LNTCQKTARSLQQYRHKYAEADAIQAAKGLRHALPGRRWRYGVIIPVCGEDDGLLKRVFCHHLAACRENSAVLAIVCLNRPDNHAHTEAWKQRNQDWLAAQKKAAIRVIQCTSSTYWLEFDDRPDALILVRNESGGENTGPIPHRQGVGLARKLAADCLLELIATGAITAPWIFSTDADACLPGGYFETVAGLTEPVVAVSLPFAHGREGAAMPAVKSLDAVDLAQKIYDLRLHLYRAGIERVNPAYAWTALGSALIVSASAYAQVRGFPRRAAGEDFYLLNKLAKVGQILTERTHPLPVIRVRTRSSNRVPFGTGPAINAILALPDPLGRFGFYHPQLFLLLAHWRQLVCRWLADDSPQQPLPDYLAQHFPEVGTPGKKGNISLILEESLRLSEFINKLSRQGINAAQRLRQFDEWLDALGLLKAVHALETVFPRLNLRALAEDQAFQRHFLAQEAVKNAFHDLWPIA